MRNKPSFGCLIPAGIMVVLIAILSILHYTIEGDSQEQLCFSETNQCVHPAFIDFWQSNGLDFGATGIAYHESLALWGFPLTPATEMTNADGDKVLTQVFERMVFEYHPKNAGTPYEIQLRRMGAEWLAATRPTPTTTATATPTSTPVGVSDAATCLNTTEQHFLTLLNQYRAANGLSALKVSKALNVAAYKHSLDMGERAYFSHTTKSPLPAGLSGAAFTDRMHAAGYTYNVTRAENIAAGYTTAQAVFDGWKSSSGHNANMLKSTVKVIGIGFVQVPGSPYGAYWTTNFGGFVDSAPSC